MVGHQLKYVMPQKRQEQQAYHCLKSAGQCLQKHKTPPGTIQIGTTARGLVQTATYHCYHSHLAICQIASSEQCSHDQIAQLNTAA